MGLLVKDLHLLPGRSENQKHCIAISRTKWIKLTLPRWESCKTLGQQILNPWVLLPCLGYVCRKAERNQCQWTSHGTKPEEHKNRQNNAKDDSVLNMTTFYSLCPWNLTAKELNQPEYHDCQHAELAYTNRSYSPTPDNFNSKTDCLIIHLIALYLFRGKVQGSPSSCFRTYHGNEPPNESEVFEVVWVDVRGWVYL